jgi:ABC-type multidrug transport system permease subunit
MRQVMAVILRELLILNRKKWRYAFSFSVSPLLYLITFGWAARGRMGPDGGEYMAFMLPGLIAMSSMTNSFALSTEINVTRFYWKTFDEIQSAPVPDWAYAAGEVASGMLRGGLAAGVVILLGFLFGTRIHVSPALAFVVAMTTFVFASIAISTAMLARSHADQGMLSSFVITPMAFLCGTFFPVELYPEWVRVLVNVLPLTPAARLTRAAAFGHPLEWVPILYLVGAAAISFVLAVRVVRQSRR